MSTREYVQTIVNRLTDEQIDELADFIEERFLPEPPNTVHSREELEIKIAEAEEDIRNGRVYTTQEVREHLREKYGI